MRQHRHRRLALTLFADFAARRHIRLPNSVLAGIKLSMILDNLIAARHDCFVTRE
jgi:hypothetical protein